MVGNTNTIEERKRQYIKQIQQINDPTAKRMAILKKMEKLVEEFGNESEKFGIKFGLYPLWAAFDVP
jgi:GMP synthase PP-ATPase subunit